MSRHILQVVTLVLMLSSQLTAASERYCRQLSQSSGYDIQTCKCSSSLLSYPHSGAKALPLVAVCGYTEESWGFTGSFLLEGNTLLHGKIRREETETFGDWPTFLVDKSSMKPFPTSDRLLRFGNEAIAIKKFHIPRITAKTPCWTADASIYLKKLEVQDGPGTDSDGSYVIDFEIHKVANFKKCKPSE
jgi:hypothetical protein